MTIYDWAVPVVALTFAIAGLVWVKVKAKNH
jgi:hypothetical protein